MKLVDLFTSARRQLTAANLATPDLDARLIVEHYTNTTRTDLITRPDLTVASETLHAIETAIARRLAGESVHRILGYREFYGLKLTLSPETLEPRPDTETLVDAALPFVRDAITRTGQCRILDLGTGTGAIALALLSQAPQARATGVDISAAAAQIAASNAASLGLSGRFQAIQSDWFEKISGLYDVIVSNPPYIRSDDIAGLSPEVRDHDPIAALDGGANGLEAYRLIAANSTQYLAEGGMVAVEIGHDQRLDVTDLFGESGYEAIEHYRDLGGKAWQEKGMPLGSGYRMRRSRQCSYRFGSHKKAAFLRKTTLLASCGDHPASNGPDRMARGATLKRCGRTPAEEHGTAGTQARPRCGVFNMKRIG
jgi:release factor glutamine methyltransferase